MCSTRIDMVGGRYNIKTSKEMSWQMGASGGFDGAALGWAAQVKSLAPAQVFVTIYHEPDHNVCFLNCTEGGVPGNTPANYRNMWRSIQGVFKHAGVDNAVYVIDYSVQIANVTHMDDECSELSCPAAAAVAPLWPGDDVIDWVFVNLFEKGKAHGVKADYNSMLQESLAVLRSVNGSRHCHCVPGKDRGCHGCDLASKPWGLGAFASHGLPVDGKPAVPAAERVRFLQDATAGMKEHPELKAYLYFDSLDSEVPLNGSEPEVEAAFQRYLASPAFVVGDAGAPPMAIKTDDNAVLLSSSLLHVWLAADSPRILNYTYLPTNYTFAGSVRGGEAFRPSVSINGGAVTCGEFGMSVEYRDTAASSTAFHMTMSCAYNYATLPKLTRARGRQSSGEPVTVVLSGAVRIIPQQSPLTTETEGSRAANVCANSSGYCPALADCYQACFDEHPATTPFCYRDPCCPSRTFGDYNISSLGFYECSSTPCFANCTRSLGPPTPRRARSATVEWSITSASSSEVSVPVRDIDLIGFEFLTLRGWSTELGTNPAYTPSYSTSDTCFIALKKHCAGKNEAQQCAMCYLNARADIDPHCGQLPAEAQYNYTGAIVEMLPHACGMPRTGCFYVPDDYPSFPTTVGNPVCTGISETYWVDDWHRVSNDGWEMGSDTKTGQLNANAVCLDGAKSRQNDGPIRAIQAGGWSADQRTGAALMSSQHHLPFNAGPKSFDAPERCQIFTISSATIKANVRCGSGLPFSVKIGIFEDLNTDGTVDSGDIALWRRSQIPDADPQYFGNVVYKLGVDYTSDYPPSHNWTRVPFLPPSEALEGSPSLPYEGYSALEWIANMSLLVDGMPQTPILMGWQRDAAWWLFGAVNDQLGGEPALRKLHSLAKLRYHLRTTYI